MAKPQSLCVVAATVHEIAPIKRALEIRQRWRSEALKAWRGSYAEGEVVLAITGMGAVRADLGVRALLQQVPVTDVLIIGVGGGLSPELTSGDLMAVQRVHRRAHGVEDALTVLDADPNLLRHTAAELTSGDLLTFDRLVCTVEEKRDLFAATRLPIVDLETFIIAKRLTESGVRWGGLRAVSDDYATSLPVQLQGLIVTEPGGTAPLGRRLATAGRIVAQSDVNELARLKKRVALCASRLEANFRRIAQSFFLDKAPRGTYC